MPFFAVASAAASCCALPLDAATVLLDGVLLDGVLVAWRALIAGAMDMSSLACALVAAT
jgi:hypothetical protein